VAASRWRGYIVATTSLDHLESFPQWSTPTLRSTPRFFAAVPRYKSPVPRSSVLPVQPLHEVSLFGVSADWQSTAADEGSVRAYSRTRSMLSSSDGFDSKRIPKRSRDERERGGGRDKVRKGAERRRKERRTRRGLGRPHRRHRYA